MLAELIDYSPHQPTACPSIPIAGNVILIDNYDSFTWNVYQYLVLEGATVTVYRNDELSLQDLIGKKPTQLVISPGPGHPDTDAGISNEAMRYFAGKIPILGVCLGEQCIYSIYGGTVHVTGEILHGKTSLISHDGKGCFQGLEQNLPVTRYHSLAGTRSTLPDCLEISAWTRSTDGLEDIVMGVRHKEYTMEGVQFHPESILTAQGRPMISNFLKLHGGTWAENSKSSTVKPAQESILEKIYQHRKLAVAAQMKAPSQSSEALKRCHELGLAPPQISFPHRIKKSPYRLSLMAEIKRASPSKGIISISAIAPSQAITYAKAGASVISVLTEPEWFKGNSEDLRLVRQALEGMPNRPAVLRKEFIFDEYQILEARILGADSVLLIVKMLNENLLQRLFLYSRSLGMEPLVEVNTAEEMTIALRLGAKVIGVNNRNLKSFEVDLSTTSKLMDMVPRDTIVCALSGISESKDVAKYIESRVGAVLVGEALMKAPNVPDFVANLLGPNQAQTKLNKQQKLLVKICGTRSAEAARVAIEGGADLIGMILVTGRKRCVTQQTAFDISKTVHCTPKRFPHSAILSDKDQATDWFQHSSQHLQNPHRALLVGVFQNQPLEYILQQHRLLELDIVQLHGREPLEWAKLIPVPVIKSFAPGDDNLSHRGYHSIPLVDSGAGGTGTRLDLKHVENVLKRDNSVKIFLAGGLDPDNVRTILNNLSDFQDQVIGVDVSSGVEKDSQQDLELIKTFILNCRKALV